MGSLCFWGTWVLDPFLVRCLEPEILPQILHRARMFPVERVEHEDVGMIPRHTDGLSYYQLLEVDELSHVWRGTGSILPPKSPPSEPPSILAGAETRGLLLS